MLGSPVGQSRFTRGYSVPSLRRNPLTPSGPASRLAIDIKLAKRAEEVCRRLTERRPSVRLGEGQIEKGTLIVDLLATDENDDEQLGCALRDVFNALPSR